jgi:hypothetical protein
MKKSFKQYLLKENKTLSWEDGTEIKVDFLGIPIGYKEFQTVSPGSTTYKKPPASFGKSYETYRPEQGREGYEIFAYPKVKQYERIYTA